MSVFDRIQLRAYFRWLNSAPRDRSCELDDWLAAEAEELAHDGEQASPSSSDTFAPAPASGKSALFHFQRLLIEIPAQSSELFEHDGSLVPTSPRAPLLVHELVHYVQAMSTVLGQRILLNWFAVQVGVAQDLLGISPLPIPLSHAAARQNAAVQAAFVELRDYFAEVNALVGVRHPRRPAYEAGRVAEFELYNYDWRHPRDHSALKGVAISMRTAQGAAFGVPILGDTLTEGMAQIAQHLCAGVDTIAEIEANAPVDGGQVYYTALCRFLRAVLPQWDARLLTLVICDVALCTRRPGSTVADLVQELRRRQPPCDSDGYLTLRRELDALPQVQAGRHFILQEIDLSDAGIPANHPLGTLFRRFLRVFREAWVARKEDPAVFLDLAYRSEFIDRIVRLLGAPPVYFNDRDYFIRLTPDEQIERACHAMRGAYDVLTNLYDGGVSECTLLRGQACKHRKTAACRENILEVPTTEGQRACVMAFAANELGLYKRPLKRYAP